MLASSCFLRMDTRCGDLENNVGIVRMLEKNILAFRVIGLLLY